MKKLLLLQPPIQDFYDTDIRLQPIGLCYLKAAINRHLPEIDVLICDFHQGHGRTTVPLPTELAYLKDYYFQPDTSPFRTFDQFFHFGADYDHIARQVADLQPDLIGISSLFTPYHREVLACAAAIKKHINVPIVVGGSHVSASPESTLQDPNVDYIIRGEGERPLVELLRALQTDSDLPEIPNLGFKENGQIFLNPRKKNYALADLPIPDFSDLAKDRYLYDGKPVCMLMASRGCPHRCAFCSVAQTFGRKFRMRDIKEIIVEMSRRYKEGYRVFDFEDDNLSFDLDRFKDLCQRIAATFHGKNIQLLAMNGISYKSLDPAALDLMRLAGFTHLNLALVSTDREIMAAMGRPHAVQDFTAVAEKAFTLGFKTVAYQILGLPGESLDSMIRTLAFLARHPLLIGVSIFYLVPGSPLASSFPAMQTADMIRARSTAMAIETDSCNRDDLFTLFITARIINFLKGLSLPHQTTELQDIFDLNTPNHRNANGLSLFRRLLSEKQLAGISRQGKLLPIRCFRLDLFYRVMKELSWLKTLDGKKLTLKLR